MRIRQRFLEADARALLFIAANPGARPSDLRVHLGVTSAGVTTLTDRLVRRGVVRRDADDADRRVNHLTLTIDLETEPWSALTAFDDEIERAILARDTSETDAFAQALDEILRPSRFSR